MIDDGEDDHSFNDDDTFTSAGLSSALGPDAVATGAAADSADDADARLTGLPRILRYAMLVEDRADSIELRLAAEINQLCPDLPSSLAWATTRDTEAGLALAMELDHLAITRDLPPLRSLGDCVRLLSLTLPFDVRRFGEFRRVTRVLMMAFDASAGDLQDERRNDLERFVAGWAALPMATGLTDGSRRWPAVHFAARLGDQLATYRIHSATAEGVRRMQGQIDAEKKAARKRAEITSPTPASARSAPASALPLHHVVIGQIDEAEIKSAKLKGIVEPVKNVLNVPLPLIATPALDRVRSALVAEFPYAAAVIDFALADLVDRPVVGLRPLLLVGEPGGGKSRFARRLGEVLGLSIWRVDAAQSDGAVLGGTDRRWHSAECCHPLLAIARGRSANPLLLLDEIEKAGTRRDYGRLWDCLLGLLEGETSARYPDPALQIPLDLSHVNYVATANQLDPLPSPLRDRFRIVTFPKPTIDDLDALLPALIKTIATERGVDTHWIAPIDAIERATIAKVWPGGSVRRLFRILEVVLQVRDHHATRQ